MKLFKRFYSEEDGVTLIEYVLVGVLISVALVLVLTDIGTTVRDFYQDVADAFP